MIYKPRDAYFEKAKREGYRSRAAYKLLELQKRFRIIHPGDRVVDLGAAPGGWLQIAAKLTGPRGKVLGVDLQPIEPFGPVNVIVLQLDITSADARTRISDALGGPADAVISDAAPKLTGIRATDAARALELNLTALRIAVEVLRPGGSLLVKGFAGPDFETFVQDLKRYFRSIQRTKPEATRKGSSEIYIAAKDLYRRRDRGADEGDARA
ncbi:MAG TPA: RlmE family RNA methyltransferase [Candidatus Eisenbacteria bacterium]|nr:RlmE family RNA methyltransferase [Candidatus Eisenbacteria bacterium]